jgi:hypothetical protein
MNPRKIENEIGHSLSQTLEEEIAVISCDRNEALADLSVVDGLREVVGEASIVQVDLDVDIDAQGLWSLPFVLEDPDHADDTKVADEDVIRHCAHGTVEACPVTLHQQPSRRTLRQERSVPSEWSPTCANSLTAPVGQKAPVDCAGHPTGSPRATS